MRNARRASARELDMISSMYVDCGVVFAQPACEACMFARERLLMCCVVVVCRLLFVLVLCGCACGVFVVLFVLCMRDRSLPLAPLAPL